MDLNECLESLQKNIPETLESTDILIFHETDFEAYKDEIVTPKGNFPNIIFYEIDLKIPKKLKDKFGSKILDYYPHPTHGKGPIGYGHPGFSVGYRSMCRFFASEIFLEEVVKVNQYQYLMRLDTDSRFLEGGGYSLFSWAAANEVLYSYIRSAVQWDNFKVVKNFKLTAIKYFGTLSLTLLLKACIIPKGKVYYTNFEICDVQFFAGESWQNFFNNIDETGGFYLHRWGDHIFRYMGVNVLLKKSKRIPVPNGFTYQHGSIFRSEDRASFRPHWLSRTKV
jgi:hypothetical protein